MNREPIFLLVAPPVFVLLLLLLSHLMPSHDFALTQIGVALWSFGALMCVVRGISIARSGRRMGLTCIGTGVIYFLLLLWVFNSPLA
jgi:hypothetical protein